MLGKQHAPYPKFESHDFLSTDLARSGSSSDLTLAERLQRSENLFAKSKNRRQELRDKFGSDPVSYPPNVSPFPPYTCEWLFWPLLMRRSLN